jgi:hypothetical protein
VCASEDRKANVGFVSSLLETEIAQRSARKEAQETTARWIVASSGLFLTLLVGLAKDAGIFGPGTTVLAEVSFIAAITLGALAAAAAIGVVRPRDYDRLGGAGLDKLNDSAFLDSPQHEVTGAVVATRVDIAKKMDELHANRAGIFDAQRGSLRGPDPPLLRVRRRRSSAAFSAVFARSVGGSWRPENATLGSSWAAAAVRHESSSVQLMRRG